MKNRATDQEHDDVAAIPPANAQRIMSSRDLPSAHEAATFRVTNEQGETRDVIVSRRKRQVLQALMAGPVYCASPVRISDNVGLLKHEHGINIHMEMYSDPRPPFLTRYGVYFLRDQVELVHDREVAA